MRGRLCLSEQISILLRGFLQGGGRSRIRPFPLRCVENGKIYIPCHHDLQIYREEKNKTFEVRITETLSRTVRVEAEDAYEAQTIVNDGYHRGHYILTAEDYQGVEYEIKEPVRSRDDKER